MIQGRSHLAFTITERWNAYLNTVDHL